MHSSVALRSDHFRIRIDGRDARLADLLPGFTEHDRLGLVVREPLGALGASALITAAVTGFYDAHRARGEEFFIYPDYFLLHVGGRLGDHSMLDVWPGHKEAVVDPDPEQLLRAVNDRGVTRLAVPDGRPSEPALDRETLASARERIVTCLAYSPSGRARDADVRIASNAVSESYVTGTLDPDALLADLDVSSPYARSVAARAGEVDAATRRRIAAARADLVEDGVPVETYRRIDLDEALALLSAQPARA